MSTPEPRTETAERDESRHDTRDDARPASEAPRPAHDEARADERPATNRDGVPLARVRRAPRVMPFLLTGAVIGALAGLFVSLDGEREWQIRLQWRKDAQGPIIDALEDYVGPA